MKAGSQSLRARTTSSPGLTTALIIMRSHKSITKQDIKKYERPTSNIQHRTSNEKRISNTEHSSKYSVNPSVVHFVSCHPCPAAGAVCLFGKQTKKMSAQMLYALGLTLYLGVYGISWVLGQLFGVYWQVQSGSLNLTLRKRFS